MEMSGLCVRFFLNQLIPTEILETVVATQGTSDQFQKVTGIGETLNLREGELCRLLGIDTTSL